MHRPDVKWGVRSAAHDVRARLLCVTLATPLLTVMCFQQSQLSDALHEQLDGKRDDYQESLERMHSNWFAFLRSFVGHSFVDTFVNICSGMVCVRVDNSDR